jgi:UDP-glucose:glycoprotein glucosyltransferase
MQMRQIDTEDMRIDLRSEEHMHWLNDIETGRIYWSWPRALGEMLKPVFPGQLHRIQRNLYNAVGLVDPGSVQSIK